MSRGRAWDRRLGNGRRDSGQAPGRASAHAEHAKLATRDRVVRVASGTQRERHARAQAQRHHKQEEGKRDERVIRRWQRRVRFREEFSGGGRFKQR